MASLHGRCGGLVGSNAVIGVVSLVAVVVIGWFASRGVPIIYTAIPVAALFALFLAARPVWLLWLAVFGGLMVVGLSKLYLPQLQLVRWALTPLAVLLVFHSIGARFRMRPGLVPAVIWWALAFAVVVALTSMVGNPVPERLIIGLKGYFQVWGLLFALAFFPWPSSVIDRLPRVLVIIALLQLPFVLHQLLVLVPKRVGLGGGIVPVDIVAGTFGASLDGGGANAVLNAFLMIVVAGLIAARQLQLISSLKIWVLSVILLIPVLLNEAKVSILYLLVMFGVLYGRDLIQRPMRFVAASLSASLLVILLMAAYTLNAPSDSRVESWQDLIYYTYKYNIDNDEINGELSRFGAIRFWVAQHGLNDLDRTLFGHGVGYTRVADTDDDFRETVRLITDGISVGIDLNMNIGNSAVVAVLWETGVVGLFCIFGLLIAMYRAAGRMEKVHVDAAGRVAAFRAVRVAAGIIFITLWHKNVLVFDVVYQTLMMLLIGYVAYWERRADSVALTDHRKIVCGNRC